MTATILAMPTTPPNVGALAIKPTLVERLSNGHMLTMTWHGPIETWPEPRTRLKQLRYRAHQLNFDPAKERRLAREKEEAREFQENQRWMRERALSPAEQLRRQQQEAA
jgi:hypothetical protein